MFISGRFQSEDSLCSGQNLGRLFCPKLYGLSARDRGFVSELGRRRWRSELRLKEFPPVLSKERHLYASRLEPPICQLDSPV